MTTVNQSARVSLYENVIQFDAKEDGYQGEQMHQLIQDVTGSASFCSTVLLLKNADHLTTCAFALLHEYLQEAPSKVMVIMISTDRSRIFPPLLQYVEG